MQKDDSVPSAGAKADSTTTDQDMQSSSNDTKPPVVGSQMSGCGRRVVLTWSGDTKNPITIQDVDTTLYPAKLSNEVMLFG